jgi:hypothetical protein
MSLFAIALRSGHRTNSTLDTLAAAAAAAPEAVRRLLPPATPTPANTLVAWERLALRELSALVRAALPPERRRSVVVTWVGGELREDGYATAELHARGTDDRDGRASLSALVIELSARFAPDGRLSASAASIGRNLLVDEDTAEAWAGAAARAATAAEQFISTDAWRASWARVCGSRGMVTLCSGAYYAWRADAAELAGAWVKIARACGQTGCSELRLAGGGDLGASVAERLSEVIREALDDAQARASKAQSAASVAHRVDALAEYGALLAHLEGELGVATAALRDAHQSALALTAAAAPDAPRPRLRVGKAGTELLAELDLNYGTPEERAQVCALYPFLSALDAAGGEELPDDAWSLSIEGFPFADLVADGVLVVS